LAEAPWWQGVVASLADSVPPQHPLQNPQAVGDVILGDRLGVEVSVLTRYLRAALHRATYKVLEDGSFFGEIPEFDGVWANAGVLEVCREELEEVLEEWILFRVSRQLSLPAVDNIELRIREVA